MKILYLRVRGRLVTAFEVSLVYIVSFRTARATWKELVSKIKTRRRKMRIRSRNSILCGWIDYFA